MLKWKHPFTCILAGPSGSGKTSFVLKLVNEKIIDVKIKRIIWCCNRYSRPNPKELNMLKSTTVIFRNDIPNFEIVGKNRTPTLYVIDDLMHDCYNKRISEVFTRGSHHLGISVILITQNVFYQSPQARTISLNVKYLVVFKNPRDQSQFSHLARQVYPKKPDELLRIFNEVTCKPFTYLLLDLHQKTNDLLRFRTEIFDGCKAIVFVPADTAEYEEVET